MPLPFAGSYPVTATFGEQDTFYPQGHPDINWGLPLGTQVVAAKTGTVVAAGSGYNGGLGNYVAVKGDDGVTLLYNHLSVLEAKVGQPVTVGSPIGLSGQSGLASGPHLGIEAIANGVKINPWTYLMGEGQKAVDAASAPVVALGLGESITRLVVGAGIVAAGIVLVLAALYLLTKDIELEGRTQ